MLRVLSEGLQQLPSLTSLDLAHQHWEPLGLRALAQLLQFHRGLRALSLFNCTFSAESVADLCDAFRSSVAPLEALNLASCLVLTAAGRRRQDPAALNELLETLAASQTARTLRVLNLGLGTLSAEHNMPALATLLTAVYRLDVLDISYCNLAATGMLRLLKALTVC